MGRKLSLSLNSLQLHDADRASIDKRDFLYQPLIRTNYYPKGLYACRQVFEWLHQKEIPPMSDFIKLVNTIAMHTIGLEKGRKLFPSTRCEQLRD